MSEQPEWKYEPMTPLAIAQGIQRCADRLARFCELRAPQIVIEAERQLIMKYWLKFPVDPESHASHIEANVLLYHSEQDHLHKTGFYDDVMRQIDGLDGEQS